MANYFDTSNKLFIDDITGLRNKNGLFEDYGYRDLENIHFVYVDIDDFKKMNTIFGIDIVDQILVMISSTLQDFCGQSDLYRVGAGQFLIITESHFICEPKTLQEILIQPVILDNMQVVVNASICVLDHDEFPKTHLVDVMKQLQLTIEIAKKKGRNQLIYSTKESREMYLEKTEIAKNLSKAIKNRDFYPKFQPFMDTFTHEIIGYEAVSRWDLNGHMLRPGEFLEAAEWTGLIYDLELCIFEEAVKFFRELKDRKDVKLSKRFKVGVHLSSYTLKRIEVSDLFAILNKYHISQKDIIIETREKHMNEPVVIEKMKELRDARFMVLLDEFSTSNVSLSFLADLHIDAMKLSEHLLQDLDTDEEFMKSMSVYKFLIDIAKRFDITVISDGVDSEQNAKLIQELDVHIGSGKYYLRAVVKDEFVQFLQNNKRLR